MDNYSLSNSNHLSSVLPNSSLQPTFLDKLDSRAVGTLILQNTITRYQTRRLIKEIFFARLQLMRPSDVIDQPEIAPLTRNSQPNESSFSFKKVISDSLTRSVTTFKDASHTLSNQQLLSMYKQRINEIERMTNRINQQKQSLERRERDLIMKLKGLKFHTVSTTEQQCQTDLKLQELRDRETQLIKQQVQMQDSYAQKTLMQQQRQNYLKHLEQAIGKKQEQMQLRETELCQQQQQFSKEDMRYRVEPLSHLADSKSLYQYFSLLKDRIYEAVEQFEQGKEQSLELLENHPLYELFNKYDEMNAGKSCKIKMQILKLLEVSSIEIRYKLEVAEEYFSEQYDKIIEMRGSLQEKNIKFIELNCYESYLDRYKQLLDSKEKELMEMRNHFRSEIKETFDNVLARNEESDRTISAITNNHPSGFKSQKETRIPSTRNRIFQNKLNNISLISQDIYRHNSHKNNFDEEKKFMSIKINQMKQQYNKRLENLQTQEIPLLSRIRNLQQENQHLKILIANNTTNKKQLEISYDNVDLALQNAKRKQLLVKFLTKWLGVSLCRNIKNPQMAKTFALNIWRIRQYDPTILGKIVELTNESYDPSVEKIWAHHCEKEKKDKLFPYKSLSLKKKEFMEEFFDLQRKQFFKTRLRTMIRSIIRNKIRKERLVVVVAFHRFIKNCSLMRTDTITLPTAISKTNVLKECRPSIIYNTQSECANNQSAKLNSRKSDYNSRTTLVCDSNKTSQIRDKSMTRIKQLNHSKENELRDLAERQRIEMQNRIRRVLACSKILGYHANRDSDIQVKKASAFYKWSMKMIHERQSANIRSFDSKFEQLEFRMNLTNTKYRISQSNLCSKIELMEQLLSIITPNH